MVICDWLDVTFAPDDVPDANVRLILMAAGFKSVYDRGHKLLFTPPDGSRGSVVITHSARFAKVSISGGACASLRASGDWLDVLFELASSPHKVTRLDCALDVRTDAADVIGGLCLRYPDGLVSLGRKGLGVTKILETRSDGRESGTYYVGYRTAARATARVYDKRLEVLKHTGVDLGHELTRFEVTARKDYGATLRDAAEPQSLFWYIASPALIARTPEGVPVWKPNDDLTGWSHEPKPRVVAEVLAARVDWCAEIEALGLLSDELGAYGRSMLLNLLARKLGLPAVPYSGSDVDLE